MVKVNCIIPAYNVGRYLDDAIKSVINQTMGFSEINLIIVNDGSEDNTEMVVKEYQKHYANIYYIYQENKGVSAARNAGLEFCEKNLPAPYLCFLDGDDKYDQYQVERLTRFFDQQDYRLNDLKNDKYSDEKDLVSPDVVFLPIKIFEKNDDVHYSYKVINRGRTRIINLEESHVFFSHVNSAMFRTSAIKGERFDENLKISEDAQFLIKILLKTNHAGWLNNGRIYYYLRKRADESSAIDTADSNPALYARIAYYKKEFEDYLFTQETIPRVVQSSVLYDIHWFKSPNNDPLKHGIDLDIDAAIEDVRYLIQNIDDDLLDQNYIPYWLKAYFKEMKYGVIKVINDIEPKFFFGEHFFETLGGSIQIQWIKQNSKKFIIRGFFVKPTYDNIELVAKIDKKMVKATVQKSYHNDKKTFLGREIFPAMDFVIAFDLPKLKSNKTYSFEVYFKYKNKLVAPQKMTHAWTSRFYDKNRLYVGEETLVTTSHLGNAFNIQKISDRSSFANSVLSQKRNYADGYLFARFMEYFEQYRNKRIWLFIDRPTAIGDNAEALFRYCANIKDGVEKYMVIPDSSYFPQFEGVSSRIIVYGSFEYKFLLMFAEKVISSTTFFEYVNYKTNIPAYQFKKIAQALSSTQQVFLQHGITKDYGIINSYLNATAKDIDLMFTVTKKETELFLSDEAGFTDKQVKLTGFPRYDLLKNNPEKIVTYVPTWRNKYSHDDDSYNPDFKKTDLFQSINDFLNDQVLLDNLRENGYKLYFKVHPKMQVQVADFDVPDDVDIIANEMTYNELYEKSAIMITDFSSAVFDFAYLRKPVIYYQPVEPEYEQDEELFSYEHNGFGEVFSQQDETVAKIIAYIENGSKMSEKYANRVDKFFVYQDKRNSERVYNEIKELPKRRVKHHVLRRGYVKILKVLQRKS
ncbi:minor teichoic acid biosynthesis protein GgaB [Lactococcus hodotermopsidis]|uniref:Minor teichoic acid biosynthesis protein GgaB n=1 Tax=Pseudolactococcus hodotermopsidis TaxID=2709157 RepID=A0A6A0BC55_9LACT|nr:CDP-glycerol glycerophosphotransferase family protein [Lactococcus hodotermopsidis]GFH42245.1 minor teichoic acid biosynthesis protein GgaB [Lactococcus hodotermopsidis]